MWLREIPKALSLDASVFGFTPSSSAAPPRPETLPLACFNTFNRFSRSSFLH